VTDENNDESRRIPLLKEVFERYPTVPINIDIKENNDILIQQVNRMDLCFLCSKVKCLGFGFNSRI